MFARVGWSASILAPRFGHQGEERDGYVPNVVYSCGGLLHGDTLVLPYGCSDSSIRVAFLDLAELLKKLQESR